MKMARAFVGHKQAVQIQIRLHRVWCIIRVSTVYLQNFQNLNKNKTYQRTTLEMKLTVLIGTERKVHLLKWAIHWETQTKIKKLLD